MRAHIISVVVAAIVMCAGPAGASAPVAPALVVGPGGNVVLSANSRLVSSINLLNGGTFTPALYSEVVLAGTGDLLVAGIPTFMSLTLSLTGTATITVPTTVSANLTLNSGRLILAGNDLLAGGIVGGSAASYVVTPDTLGLLASTISQYQPVTFPVGNSAYDPITIQPAVGTDRAYVAVMDSPSATGLLPTAALGRAWLVRLLNAPGSDGALTMDLQWNAGEQGAGFDRSLGQSTSAQAWRWLGGAWVQGSGVRVSESGPVAGPFVDRLLTPEAGLWTLASPLVLGVDPGAAEGAPRAPALEQSAPNPCTRPAAIRYGLARRGTVSLDVYTALGERVATLASGEREAGWYVATFDPGRLPGGIYFYRLVTAGRTLSRKLIVVR